MSRKRGTSRAYPKLWRIQKRKPLLVYEHTCGATLTHKPENTTRDHRSGRWLLHDSEGRFLTEFTYRPPASHKPPRGKATRHLMRTGHYRPVSGAEE